MNRIAILLASREDPETAARFPNDALKFQRLFRPVFPGADMPVIDLWELASGAAELPGSLDGHDAYIVTGSSNAVYDELPWLEELFAFIRRLHAAEKPTLGVCFGHQAVAQALGGKVEKAAGGWGLGVRPVPFFGRRPWMPASAKPPVVHLLHSHQDQVVEPPRGVETLAGDRFCPHACMAAGNHLITVQGHPEFDRDFVRAKIDALAGELPDGGARALRSLDIPDDGALFARWIRRFWEAGRGGGAPP